MALFSRTTTAIMYNFKAKPVQRMLDFDYLCRREPSIAALVSPGTTQGLHKVFFGPQEILIPTYGSTAEAAAAHPDADVFINFASQRSAFASSMEALDEDTLQTIVIIAEGVPEKNARMLIAKSKGLGKVVIGPATVGGIHAGAFKIGDTAGTVDNILSSKLYRPGSVGFVSKSGGLSNECYSILSRTTDGVCEGIAIGGDAFPASTFADHIARFQEMEEVKMIVLLGELGGDAEYDVVKLLQDGVVTKPVVAWVSGTCATMFKTEVQFGHAGARSGGDRESAQAKNNALREAGAHVPTSYEGFEALIKEVFDGLVADGTVVPSESEVEPPPMPVDHQELAREGRIRRSTGIVSTICDDRGDQPTYAGKEIADVVASGRGIGGVISLLWFKRELPVWATRFIELVIVLTADHGPAVSGAHNTIVAARAGKDLVASVASGLLCIGDRFGGAIDGAARTLKKGCDEGMDPHDLVAMFKKQGRRIPGIGHRIKSADNMDQRVIIMKEYAREHFPETTYLEYALALEEVTLKKARNLVLNVDGCMAALFLDLFTSSPLFSDADVEEMVAQGGYLNGMFVIARCIGLCGHFHDQNRLGAPLYRHPWEDILYSSPVNM